MNRVELKENAKRMIVGNKWYLWKPLVFFNLALFCIVFVVGLALGLAKVDQKTITLVVDIICAIIGIFESAFMIGYAKYCIEFVRGNKMEWKETISFAKKHFLTCFLVSFLTGLIVIGCSILLIIPGIIAGIALTFYQEVCADNPELKVTEIIKKAWNMTKGHRMEIFVLGLSFIGWFLVSALTLGILYIWLMPYMVVTMVLAYEELRKAA